MMKAFISLPSIFLPQLLALSVGAAGGAAVANSGFVQTDGPGVRFHSGPVVYVEGLENGQWSGRYWSADGRLNVPGEGRPLGSFLVEINHEPVANGWAAARIFEFPGADRGARHIVVALTSQARSLAIAAHTLLDGTRVPSDGEVDTGSPAAEDISMRSA
jgi:hypothetical protein